MACMEGGDDEHLMTKLRKSRLTVSDDFGFVPSLSVLPYLVTCTHV